MRYRYTVEFRGADDQWKLEAVESSEDAAWSKVRELRERGYTSTRVTSEVVGG